MSYSDKGSKGAEKQTADTIRLEELAVENGRMRDDLKKLRDALSDEAGEDNAQFKEMCDQFDYLQDELERRREECIQLRTVLANASLDEQPLSLRWGLPLPEAAELFTAYKTQKNVISQLQEQLAEEKGRARETEAELKAEVDKLSKTCHSQQQVSREQTFTELMKVDMIAADLFCVDALAGWLRNTNQQKSHQPS